LSLYDNALPLGTRNLDHHIQKIKTFSQNRKLWKYSLSLAKAIEDDDNEKKIKLLSEISDFQIENTRDEVVLLADQKITPRTWLLEGAIPDGFPTIIYGAGGMGKSFLALHLAILACQGGQRFMNPKFPKEPRNTLIVDYELDLNEQARRAQQVTSGLNNPDVPTNLHYFSPSDSLLRVFPKLKGIIKSKDISFVIIDSIGASGTDGESVQDVVSMLTKLKDLGVATLVLDHQSKMQTGDKYGSKTPFGSVYKENLSRSVFQLSKVEAVGNRVTLKLKHTKANFSRLQDDLVFDMSFEGDKVLFTESTVKSQEAKELERVWEVIKKLEDTGGKAIQKAITAELKGEIGRDKVISLLEIGEGTYWDKQSGERTEIIYKTRNLENGTLSSQDSRFLKNDHNEYDIPKELFDESPNFD
jgi:RecA-family ATPase